MSPEILNLGLIFVFDNALI